MADEESIDISEDVTEALRLLNDVPEMTTSVLDTIKNILKRTKSNELPMEKGLSFLDLKNVTFLQYLMNLTFIIHQKLLGKTIENDSTVDRLVELRIVLEKMRPIDEKLKYQINKLLNSVSGNIDTKDPLQFRANPESLDNQDEEVSDEDEKPSNVYVPPKISAAYFDEDNLETRKQKQLEKSQKRALSSSMMHELRKEYDTGPEEITEEADPYRIKLNAEVQERTRYEEEYMTRLPMTKKQKHESSQLLTISRFRPKFGDISSLEMQSDDVSLKRRGKESGKKKGKFSRKTRKKKGKKQWH